MNAHTVVNPILPGCHPDPSICRVGDDYYLVTSTFEYLPGLPVHHSRDLVHWRVVGHATPSVDVREVRSSGGLYAPTIRFHDGVFYVVCTVVQEPGTTGRSGNYVVTATDPAGPWSEPVWLTDAAGGFDPSLLFDDDGRAWYCGTRPALAPQFEGHTEVWLRELDLATLSLVGPERVLWEGAVRGAVWAEGPHLYKIGDWYYLLVAEGGTAEHHAVVVARSESVTGPYVGDRANPVLTHRHLGRAYPVYAVGHADLVETQDGSWYAVLLAVRHGAALGRETHLVPVTWEDGWPVFAPGVGLVTPELPAPAIPQHAWDDARALVDTFDAPDLDLRWDAVRALPSEVSRLEAGALVLPLRAATLHERATPAFVGRRLEHVTADVDLVVDVAPQPGELAGLALRLSDDDHLALVVTLDDDGRRGVRALRTCRGERSTHGWLSIEDGPVLLRAAVRGRAVTFSAGAPGAAPQEVAAFDDDTLDPRPSVHFTGTWVGGYGTSAGRPTTTELRVLRYEVHPA